MTNMSSPCRERRIFNEWSLLEQTGRANQGTLELLGRRQVPEEDVFRLAVHETSAIVRNRENSNLVCSHVAEVHFTRFFPSVPIEVNLQIPVLHPNVDPENGFVCLWHKFGPADTVIDALHRLQKIISWNWVNFERVHVLQPAAVEWFANNRTALPLGYRPILWPEDCGLRRQCLQEDFRRRRRRLTPSG